MTRSPLLPIFLVVLIDILGLTIIMPLLPFYAEHFGASPLVVGLLISTYALCQLIAGPVLGQISDRVGRKPVLIVSQIGTFAGFIVLAFAPALWVVFLARVIDGATAGNLSIAQAYISDVSEPENRARAFGIIGMAFGLGFLVGPGVSGYLAHFDIRYPIFLAAALSATSVLATYLMLPAHKPERAAAFSRRVRVFDFKLYAAFFRRPHLGALLTQFFLFALAFAIFTSGFALFAERGLTWGGKPFGPREVGFGFTLVGGLGIVVQGVLIGRLVQRFGERMIVRLGFLADGVGYAWLGLSRTVAGVAVGGVITAYGNGTLRPALQSLITQHAERHEQGLVLGVSQSLMSIAQIAGPIVAGLLIEAMQLSLWGITAAAVAAVGFAVATITSRRHPEHVRPI